MKATAERHIAYWCRCSSYLHHVVEALRGKRGVVVSISVCDGHRYSDGLADTEDLSRPIQSK